MFWKKHLTCKNSNYTASNFVSFLRRMIGEKSDIELFVRRVTKLIKRVKDYS